MKKFLVSALVIALMMACVIAVPAFALEETTVTFAPYTNADGVRQYCSCGNAFVADEAGTIAYVHGENGCRVYVDGETPVKCDGTILSWSKFPLTSKDPVATGNYYLTDNLAQDGIALKSDAITIGTSDTLAQVRIDMNGLNLNMNNKNVRAFSVTKGSSLSLYNTGSKGGSVQALGPSGVAGVVQLNANGQLNLYGVSLERLEGHSNVSAAGAIIMYANSETNAYDCSIIGGTITGNGGAMNIVAGATVNLHNVTVTGGTTGGNGGAIVNAGTLHMTNCTVIGGATTGNGGAISNTGTVTMNGGSVTGAATGGVGGAIYSTGTLELTKVNITGAETVGNGGAICAASGSLTITGGSVTGGTVTGTNKNGGNLFIGAGVSTNLTNVTISEGSATNGGNLYVSNNHTGALNVKECIIHSGTASTNGGNVWLGTAAANAEGNLELAGFHGTKIYNGTAANGGSVYTARRLNLVRSTVGYDLEDKEAGGVATDCGGSVFVNDAELLLQKGSKIGYGTATNDGGNVYVTGENGNGKLTVYDQSVIQWGQAVNGGNVYLNNGNVYFGGTVDATHDTGCQIVNGQATGNGGNVYVAAGHGNAQGDALIAGGGSANTTVDGGNIYVAANASFTLRGRSIVRNGKDLPGGQQTGNIYNAGQLDVLGEAKIYGGSTITKTGERNIYCASNGTVTVTDSVNDKDEYVVNESVIRGGLMVNGGKLVLGGSPWIKSNAVGERSLYLFNNTVVDATALTEDADVEIFDTAVSGEGRKIADVTAEQTWIKDAFRLSEDSKLAYVITREIDAEGNVSLWLRPAIAASVETETGVYDYQTTDEAITNCDATETIILDLKGQTVELNIPGNLKLIDSANDDYTTQTGTFTGTVGGEVSSLVDANGNRYLVVENEGVYTAHRYAVELTHVSLNPAKDALGYKAQVLGDAVVQANVSSVGFNLWVDGALTVTKTTDAKQSFSLRLQNILKNNGGETVIYGNAFAVIGGRTVTTSDYGTTMKAVLKMVNDNWASYDQTQQIAVKTLCDQYMDTVSGWKLSNIYPEKEETASAT